MYLNIVKRSILFQFLLKLWFQECDSPPLALCPLLAAAANLSLLPLLFYLPLYLGPQGSSFIPVLITLSHSSLTHLGLKLPLPEMSWWLFLSASRLKLPETHLLFLADHRHLKLMCPAWTSDVMSPDLLICMYSLPQWIIRPFPPSCKAESWEPSWVVSYTSSFIFGPCSSSGAKPHHMPSSPSPRLLLYWIVFFPSLHVVPRLLTHAGNAPSTHGCSAILQKYKYINSLLNTLKCLSIPFWIKLKFFSKASYITWHLFSI